MEIERNLLKIYLDGKQLQEEENDRVNKRFLTPPPVVEEKEISTRKKPQEHIKRSNSSNKTHEILCRQHREASALQQQMDQKQRKDLQEHELSIQLDQECISQNFQVFLQDANNYEDTLMKNKHLEAAYLESQINEKITRELIQRKISLELERRYVALHSDVE